MEVIITVGFILALAVAILWIIYTCTSTPIVKKKDIDKLDKVAGRYFIDVADPFEAKLKEMLIEKLPEMAWFNKDRITITRSKYYWYDKLDMDNTWDILRQQWSTEDLTTNTRLKKELYKQITVKSYSTIDEAIIDIMINYTFFQMFDLYNDEEEIKKHNSRAYAAFQVYVNQHPEAYQLARLRDRY